MNATPGQLVVISGPSGSGKTSIIDRLRDHPRVSVSVSVTTRPRRPHEVEGRDYTFVDRGTFLSLVENDCFVETNDVFGNGHLYGSLRSELLDALAVPDSVYIMEVDVVGAKNIRSAGHQGRHIFIAPPSQQVLEQRLRSRGTDDEEAIERRLSRAAIERRLAEEDEATIVVNHVLDDAVAEVLDVLGLGPLPTEAGTGRHTEE